MKGGDFKIVSKKDLRWIKTIASKSWPLYRPDQIEALLKEAYLKGLAFECKRTKK